jgi:hypothetical protein
MAGLKLANTTFSTKPDEALATVDAYEASTSGIVNKIPDITDSFLASGVQGLKVGKQDLSTLFKSGTAIAGLKMNPDSLLKGVVAGGKGLLGSLKGLPAGLQTDLLKASGFSKISATAQGLTTTITQVDASTLTGLGKMINDVSCADFSMNFFDLSGLTNFLSNLIKAGSGLGLPNIFHGVTCDVTNKEVLNGVTKNSLPVEVNNSNLSLLSNIADSPVARNVTKFSPSFIKDFTKGFKLPPNAKQKDYANILNTMTSSFTKLDPLWNKIKRGASDALNLDPFIDSSKDMDKLLRARANILGGDPNTGDPSLLDTSGASDDIQKAACMKSLYSDNPEVQAQMMQPADASLSEAFPETITDNEDWRSQVTIE